MYSYFSPKTQFRSYLNIPIFRYKLRKELPQFIETKHVVKSSSFLIGTLAFEYLKLFILGNRTQNS